MRIFVTITKELDDTWTGTADDFLGMTDAEIVALVKEDLVQFVDGASWTVTREVS